MSINHPHYFFSNSLVVIASTWHPTIGQGFGRPTQHYCPRKLGDSPVPLPIWWEFQIQPCSAILETWTRILYLLFPNPNTIVPTEKFMTSMSLNAGSS